MIETEDQRRWWFATHPEYSWSRRGFRSESKVDPRDVDKYVDEALKYEKGPVADLLKSVKRNFGTEAYHNEHNQRPKEPQATIGPPKPPGLSDRARYVLDVVCPGLTKAYDRWRTGYYKAYPWAPGPLYDALPDLMSLVPIGLAKIQAALAKAVSSAEIAALQKARQELLKIWDYANFPRGSAIEDHLGRNLPRTFKGIDQFENGVVTSIKSMDLRLNSYQDGSKILSQGRKYVDNLVNFDGAAMKGYEITVEQITERVLRIGVPPGATEIQKSAFKAVVKYGKQNGIKVEVIRVP
ncbi:MAG: hypothetical protein ACLP5H_01665 [Desulfomonilaceae bacterium]